MAAPEDLQRTFTESIARNYDEILGPAWFGPIAAALAQRLPADPRGEVLELACGTGLMTGLLRQRLDNRYRLVATDLSPAMLDYARDKLARTPGIEWQTADAAKLPFGDGAFGALACSLGVMFVPDKKALFAETHRVLKPGGHFIFNVWDRAEENPCVQAYAGVIEAMFPGDAEMRFRLPYEMYDERLLNGLLDEAGFAARRIEKVRLPIEGVTPREIATGQVRGTPRGLLLAKRGADLDLVIDRVATALEAVGGAGGPFRSHTQTIIVDAVRAA